MRALVVSLVAGGLVLIGGPAVAAPSSVPGAAAYPQAAVCVDTAGALSSGTCARITAVLDQDEQASPDHDEIAVAVVPTTGNASIETWATGLFNAWGVGQAGKDNGVLLVVALEDRALRIATGDGLRGRLPDGTASEIIGGTITPLLRDGRTEDAVLAGLDGIRTALGHDISGSALAAGVTVPDPFADDAGSGDDGGSGSGTGILIVIVVLVAVVGVVWSFIRGDSGGGYSDDDGSYTRRRSYSPRRSFSSSSSSRRSSSSSSRRSFGGGRSSGGGSSGRW